LCRSEAGQGAGIAPASQEDILEILLRAQDREIEARHFDPRHVVAGGRSMFCMGIGECLRMRGY